MLVHRRVTPSIKFAVTHLYTWVERGTVRVKCLAQEHNTMSPARTRTWTARSVVQRTNHEATAPPQHILCTFWATNSNCGRNYTIRLLVSCFCMVVDWHVDVAIVVLQQFIEPCKQLEWDSKETEIFLSSLVDTCSKLDSLHRYDTNLFFH